MNDTRTNPLKWVKIHNVGALDLLFTVLISTIFIIGNLLSTNDSVDVNPLKTPLKWAYLCGSLVTGAVILSSLIFIKQRLQKSHALRDYKLKESLTDKKLWLLLAAAIYLLYLPIVLLTIGTLSPDSWSSVRQSIGAEPLSNMQPIIFTAFISIFIHIGLFFNSLTIGILLASLVQSAILAMVFASVIVWMRQHNVNKALLVASFIYYALLPINSVAGTILWKDILFAAFAMLLLMKVAQLYEKGENFFVIKNIVSFIGVSFLFCAWRNNGFYAYICFIVLVSFFNRKTFFAKNYLLLIITPVFLYILYSLCIALVCSPSPLSETLSVPVQQIARTVKYHSDTISSNDKTIINEVLPYSQLSKKYNANLSDPVKYSLSNPAFKLNKARYIKLWVRLFINHKETYALAFLYNTYGYAYPLMPSTSQTDTVLDNSAVFNAIKNYSDTAYAHGNKPAIAVYSSSLMNSLPILNNIGLYTIILLFAAYAAIVKRKHELTGVFAVLVGVFITTLVGPVNGEFRYLYLFVIAVPFVLGSVYSNKTMRSLK